MLFCLLVSFSAMLRATALQASNKTRRTLDLLDGSEESGGFRYDTLATTLNQNCVSKTKYAYTCVEQGPGNTKWLSVDAPYTPESCASACGGMGFGYAIIVRGGDRNCRCTNSNAKQPSSECCDCYEVECLEQVDPTPTPTPPCDDTQGTCTIVEDPHVKVFDGNQITLTQTTATRTSSNTVTEMWVVRSQDVHIQARVANFADSVEKTEFVKTLAVGGPFIANNILVIGSLEDDITWNGMRILEHQDSTFEMRNNDFAVKASRGEHSSNVADMPKENPGVNIEFPMNVSLIVNRLKGHLNVALTMDPQIGGQDGLCGNFNGVASDDSFEFVTARSALEVPETESLFDSM